MKKAIYFIQFLLTIIIFFIFRLLPINFVSIIGGKIFQIFGPYFKSHQIAILNVKKVFNESDQSEINKIVSKSWQNLGKTFIEFTILNRLLNNKNHRIEIIGKNYLDQIIENKEQVIFFGIHQANWEILVPSLDRLGIKLGAIYRHINNPFINSFIINLRNKTLKSKETFYTPKGKESAKQILSAINDGKSMILLIDQKDSAGHNIKLFNYFVKTQIGFLKIAKKNNLKLIPIQAIRKKINNFKIIVHPPLNSFDKIDDDIKNMSIIHKIIEKWIKDNPSQWLWQHKRFT